MTRAAVTIDFHDTLVHCDPWFELEVRHLPSSFLRWHACRNGAHLSDAAGRSLDAAYRVLRLSIIEHGHELTAERCLAVLFERAGITIDDATVSEGVAHLMAEALPEAKLVDGAGELVAALAAAGVPLGVVSSAVYHPFLEWALDRLALLAQFDVVTTSASCGYYKSRPEIYWQTLEALNGAPARSVHIGDSSRFDVGGAGRAGMRTVWLNARESAATEHAPDLTLSTLRGSAPDIIRLLER